LKIPKKIRIGESEYNVKKCRIIDWNGKLAGQINYGSKVMKMKEFEDERVTEETFFHEMSHGVLKELEFNHPAITRFRNDETFVQEMGLLLRKAFLDLLSNQER
jgi:hypothetical protein